MCRRTISMCWAFRWREDDFHRRGRPPKGPNAVVLSYGLWQSTFHGDPSLVGRAIDLRGEPYAVVGVLARGTVTPGNADLFTPLRPATTGECGGTNCGILMRLNPGATWQQVAAELEPPAIAENRQKPEECAQRGVVLCAASGALCRRGYAAEGQGVDGCGRIYSGDRLRQSCRTGAGAHRTANAGDCDSACAGCDSCGSTSPVVD